MKIDKLTFSYGDKKIFDNFCMEIPDNGITALSGPSGCGKTTLLRLIAGLEDAGGSVIVKDGEGLSPDKIAFMFQEDRLLAKLSAKKQLHVAVPGCDAEKWLDVVGLKTDADTPPEKMSGGMKRRLALARCLAFAQDKELMLLDEPFTGVDAERTGAIAKEIRRMGIPVIITGHTEETLKTADRIIQLQAGSPE